MPSHNYVVYTLGSHWFQIQSLQNFIWISIFLLFWKVRLTQNTDRGLTESPHSNKLRILLLRVVTSISSPKKKLGILAHHQSIQPTYRPTDLIYRLFSWLVENWNCSNLKLGTPFGPLCGSGSGNHNNGTYTAFFFRRSCPGFLFWTRFLFEYSCDRRWLVDSIISITEWRKEASKVWRRKNLVKRRLIFEPFHRLTGFWHSPNFFF